MTFIVDGTNGLTFNNSTTQASAGVVLQVVNFTTSTTFSTASSSYISTGFGASITPKFVTSKILILARVPVSIGTGSSFGCGVALYKGTTSLYSPLSYEYFITTSSSTAPRLVDSINYLDSPATTSSIAYNLYVVNYNGGTMTVNETGPLSITLMEIAG